MSKKMLNRLITDDIRISISTGADKSMIFVDPSKIELVLMNLVVKRQGRDERRREDYDRDEEYHPG